MIDFLDCYDWLWKRSTHRRESLEYLSTVVVKRPAEWDYEAQRVVPPMTYDDGCFLCRTTDRWLVWHHAVQVQHGGSNNPWNLVRLCHPCHREIHPWLPESINTVRGWTCVGTLEVIRKREQECASARKRTESRQGA